jgi:hypothetical protein
MFTQTARINPIYFSTEEKLFKEIVSASVKARENLILTQLNDFISRGLIEVQTTGSIIVRSPDSNDIEVKEAVTLVLKDKEYIEKLEQENRELKDKLESVNNILTQLIPR